MVKSFNEFIYESNNACKNPEIIPGCLLEIIEYLNSKNFKPTRKSDGRVGSISDEELCIEILKESDRFKVVKDSEYEDRMSVSHNDKILIFDGKDRDWYDIRVKDTDGKIYYINIKSSSLSRPDNVGSLTSIFYGMFGKTKFENKKDLSKQYGELFAEYNKHFKSDDFDKFESIDYYYLIINKNDTKHSFFTSINHFTKDSIQPNGSNLPFQCNWIKNTTKAQQKKICLYNHH